MRLTLADPAVQAASSKAVTLVVFEPSGAGAAFMLKVHVFVPLTLLGTVEVAECAPASVTQFEPVSVTTVRVSGEPLRANSVPPTTAVPPLPVNVALVIVAPRAAPANS